MASRENWNSASFFLPGRGRGGAKAETRRARKALEGEAGGVRRRAPRQKHGEHGRPGKPGTQRARKALEGEAGGVRRRRLTCVIAGCLRCRKCPAGHPLPRIPPAMPRRRRAIPGDASPASFACSAVQCPGRFPGMLCCQMPGTPTPYRSSPAFPVCLLPNARHAHSITGVRPPSLSAVPPNAWHAFFVCCAAKCLAASLAYCSCKAGLGGGGPLPSKAQGVSSYCCCNSFISMEL